MVEGKKYGKEKVILLCGVAGVVIGGIIMIWSDHLAYWIVAAILLVVAYLILPKKRLLVDDF
jgi:uncharacterized membrane protein YoaK (UPF0700 family)